MSNLVADDEAQDILGDPNADGDSIPACYYNVFFVFYSEFRYIQIQILPFKFNYYVLIVI